MFLDFLVFFGRFFWERCFWFGVDFLVLVLVVALSFFVVVLSSWSLGFVGVGRGVGVFLLLC